MGAERFCSEMRPAFREREREKILFKNEFVTNIYVLNRGFRTLPPGLEIKSSAGIL
jgi:hypothetical protein